MLATKFKTDKPTECPQCGNPLETYIGEPPLGFVRQEITTVGQQGERNFKKLGKVKGQEMMAKSKENKEKADKQMTAIVLGLLQGLAADSKLPVNQRKGCVHDTVYADPA